MNLSKPTTSANLEAAFAGESMANRKYLFFADVAKTLGNNALAKLFRDTAAQETEHAFTHFRLLHPELMIDDPAALNDADKQKMLTRCLELAIEGETYEFTTMYPEFAAQARADRDSDAEAEFNEQIDEAQQHSSLFRRAARNFGFLVPIEQHHAERYGVALKALEGKGVVSEADQPVAGKWICKVCSMIYDPAIGDPESGISAGTAFEAIPEDWVCPLLRQHLSHWLNDYREWSSQRSKGDSYAAVCYLSQYGFSDRLSQAIAHGIGKADAQVQLVDLRATDPQELTALVGEAKAVVVPTWPAEPDGELQASIGTLLAALQPKQLVGVYDAFGGNDEPIDAVAEQLRNQGLKPAFEPLRIRQLPQGGDYQRCEESGTDLGQILTRKKSIEALRSIDANLDKALGRLTGGLYIVTASQGEDDARRSGAMVASWVAQASFRPPGLSVAVAKDRAIEALMQVGDRFVINVLRQDRHKPLMQHFLKRFPPRRRSVRRGERAARRC